MPQARLRDALEKLRFLAVRQRETALDVIDAEDVHGQGNLHLVVQGVADVLALHTVAQGGVEDDDPLRSHGCRLYRTPCCFRK
jgi:hypothetical protein